MELQNEQQMTQKTLTFCLTTALTILLNAISFQAQATFVLRAKVRESPAETATRAEAFNAGGVEVAEAGKFAEAVKLFQEAIRLNSAYTAAYGNLGAAFYHLRQPQEAIAAV